VTAPTPEGPGRARRRGGPWLLAGAVAAAAIVASTHLPVAQGLLSVVAWIRGIGAWGALLYAALYVAAAVLLLPGSVLTLGAGFLYGAAWGTALVSPVSVLAATAAFRLGRGAGRARVAARFAGDPRFAAIDAAVAEDGLRVVLLLRLSPLFPFNLANYALGLTGVRTRDFVLGSWLGMLPATALFVYAGSLASDAAELLDGGAAPGPAVVALRWGGLLATLAVTGVLTRTARGALARALDGRRIDQPDPSGYPPAP
jgi:uncharacterized membrane protein YdjX (TVP38/TMEM64 family)